MTIVEELKFRLLIQLLVIILSHLVGYNKSKEDTDRDFKKFREQYNTFMDKYGNVKNV